MLPKVRQVRMQYVKMIHWHQSYMVAFSEYHEIDCCLYSCNKIKKMA